MKLFLHMNLNGEFYLSDMEDGKTCPLVVGTANDPGELEARLQEHNNTWGTEYYF